MQGQTVLPLLALGLTVEQIAEALQLDVEQVKKIQDNDGGQ
ncbi:MAG: hypothetical protein AB4063_02515 [Crocosphaera sp.]